MINQTAARQQQQNEKLAQYFDETSLKNFEHKLRQIAEDNKTQETDYTDNVEEEEEEEELDLMPGEYVYTCSIQFKTAGRRICQIYISQGELYVAKLTSNGLTKVLWKENIARNSRVTLQPPCMKNMHEESKKRAKQ